MRRLWKILTALIILTGGIVVSGVVVLKSIDFSQYKDDITNEFEKITGRKISIKGEFRLDIGLNTVLAVENVSFANAPWGSRSNMARLDRLAIDVKILPLIMGDIQVERLILIGLDALIETNAKGIGNWVFAGTKPGQTQTVKNGSSSSAIPIIQEVDIKKMTFTFRDGQNGKVTKTFIDELTLAGKDNKSPLKIFLSAQLNGLKYHAAGSMGSVDTLLNGGKPFDVDVRGSALGVLVALKGNIDRPQEAKGFNLNLSVSSKNLEKTIQQLKTQFPELEQIVVPKVGPFKLAGQVKGSADNLGLSNIDAVVGEKNKLLFKVDGSVANINQIKGINLRITTAGEELADTVNFVRPYVPILKELTIPKIGPYAISARVRGSRNALSISGIDTKFGKPSTILLSVRGSLSNALSGKGANLLVGLEGQSLVLVEKMTGMTLPKIPPFNISARVSDKGGYTVDNLKAKIGISDLNGRVSVNLAGAKPNIEARLESNRLDLDELFPAETSPQLPQQRSAQKAKPEKLFSRQPFDIAGLRAINVRASFKIDRLKVQGNLVEKLESSASLISGKLKVNHLFATLDKGKLVGKLTYDASGKRPFLLAKADIRGLPLGQFLKKVDITDTLKMSIDAELDVRGEGNSPHALMANLKGKTKVVGRNGRINSNFLSGAMSGVADIIPWFESEDANKIICFVSRFDINNGVATSKVMLLETTGMTVNGHGRIDLGREYLDITFVPKAKQTSLASFALPMQFKGPLNDPKISANVSKETIATVGNVVSTVGSVLLGPVGIMGSVGLNLTNEEKTKKNEPCIQAMGAYSKPKSTQQTSPNTSKSISQKSSQEPSQEPSQKPSQKTGKGAVGTVKRNVDNVLEGAGEAVKGVGNALKDLFGGSK